MTKNDPTKQFELRIARLDEERLYSRPGWRVPIRKARTESFSWSLSLKEWLMYPLFIARV